MGTTYPTDDGKRRCGDKNRRVDSYCCKQSCCPTYQHEWYSNFLAILLIIAGCDDGDVAEWKSQDESETSLNNNCDIRLPKAVKSYESTFGAIFRLDRSDDDTWLVDSGATIHVVRHISYLSRVVSRHNLQNLKVANGDSVHVDAIGEVDLQVNDHNGKLHTITLKNVHVASGIDANIISVSKLSRGGIRTVFGEHGKPNYFKICNVGAKIPFDSMPNGHYRFDPDKPEIWAVSDQILHSRLGHIGEKRFHHAKHNTTGLDFAGSKHAKACPTCDATAPKRRITRKSDDGRTTSDAQFFGREVRVLATSVQGFGGKVNSDLYGPLPASVDGKFKYAINFYDKDTKTGHVEFLRSKSSSEVQEALQSFQRKFDVKVKQWHTDNGGEFSSNDLRDFCDELAIKRTWSIPYESRGNSRAERYWGLLARPMRAMLKESGLPLTFWTYAMQHSAQLHDMLPTRGLPDWMSPFEARTGIKPDIGKLRVFGCRCFVYLEKHERRSKASPTHVEAVHLGCDPERTGGYMVYIPSLKRFTTATHIRFRESEFLPNITGFGSSQKLEKRDHPNRVAFREDSTDDNLASTRDLTDSINSAPHADESRSADEANRSADAERAERDQSYDHGGREKWSEDHCSDSSCTKGRHPPDEPHSYEEFGGDVGRPSARTRGALSRANTIDEHAHLSMLSVRMGALAMFAGCGVGVSRPYLFNIEADGMVPEPKSFNEAMSSHLAYKWQQAMDKEIADLLGHETWELVRRDSIPKGRRASKSKWVYKIKYLRDGTIERFKARFVVCGYSQIKGQDYTRAFSSTLRATSFRILLAIAAYEGLTLHQMDVTNAFTQADIDEDLWVEQAKGFEIYDKDGGEMVLKLKRALYGTKQAGRLWQDTLRQHLLDLGFKCSISDPCLFSLQSNIGKILLGVYVDDIIVASSNQQAFEWFSTNFTSKFRSKYLGKLEWFLGVAIDQDSKGVTIHQEKYICDLADKFLPDIKHVNILRDTPAVPERFRKLGKATSDEEREKMRTRPYLQLVGSLLYLSVMCRPDIAYHMSVLCRYMGDPSEECFNQALSVLTYLYKTRDYKIRYSKDLVVVPGCLWEDRHKIHNNMGFHVFSDSSWGDNNPTYGYVSFMAGGPVSWTSKNCKSADSSCEAEYTAASKASRDVTFIRNVCDDLGYTLCGSLAIAVDNTAAIDVAYNLGVTGRNKHFEREIHYIREKVAELKVKLTWVATKHQTADICTKCLEKVDFMRHRDSLIRQFA